MVRDARNGYFASIAQELAAEHCKLYEIHTLGRTRSNQLIRARKSVAIGDKLIFNTLWTLLGQ